MLNILFDLDGTLIDSSERMYRLFMELIPQASFSKQKYWELKRQGKGHREIIREYFPFIDFAAFEAAWMSEIEEDRYLEMDSKWEETDTVLELLGKKYCLYLVTARQRKGSLMNELDRLEMGSYFKDIFVTENRHTKKELLQINNGICAEDSYFVSDGGKDIQAGNELGFRTVAAAYGFFNENTLKQYCPLYIINSLSEIMIVLKSCKIRAASFREHTIKERGNLCQYCG